MKTLTKMWFKLYVSKCSRHVDGVSSESHMFCPQAVGGNISVRHRTKKKKKF